MTEIEDRLSKLERTLASLKGGAVVAGFCMLVFFGVTYFHQIPSKVQALLASTVEDILPRKVEAYFEANHSQFLEKIERWLEIAKRGEQTVGELEAYKERFITNGLSPSYMMWMDSHDTTKDTVEQIPQEKFSELCGDDDGCLIQLQLKKWNNGDGHLHVGLSPWVSVSFDRNTSAWTSNPVVYDARSCYQIQCIYGRDKKHDGTRERKKIKRSQDHLHEAFAGKPGEAAACYLTDIEYSTDGNGTDSKEGIYLLSAAGKNNYNVRERRCGVLIRD